MSFVKNPYSLQKVHFSHLILLLIAIFVYSTTAQSVEIPTECRNKVQQAIQMASPNEQLMKESGDRALSQCMSDHGYSSSGVISYEGIKAKYDREQLEEKSKIFGEKTLVEASIVFILYLIGGLLISLVPVIGPFIGIPLMIVGAVILAYTLIRLYYVLMIILALLVLPFFLYYLYDEIRVRIAKRRDAKLVQKQEADKKLLNKQILLNGGFVPVLKQCMESEDKDEFRTYLEQMTHEDFEDNIQELLILSISELGKSNYTNMILEEMPELELMQLPILEATISSCNLPAMRTLLHNGFDPTELSASQYHQFLLDNIKKSYTKGSNPIKKKAYDIIRLVINDLDDELIDRLRQLLKNSFSTDYDRWIIPLIEK